MPATSMVAVAAYPVSPLPLVAMRWNEYRTSSAVSVLPFWNSMPLRSWIVYCFELSWVTLSARPLLVSW